MLILQVLVGRVEPEVEETLSKRFGKFYERESGKVEYPISCDSHGMDVFDDEFTTVDEARPVDYAAIIYLPFEYEQFEPFTEDNSGSVIHELGEEAWELK